MITVIRKDGSRYTLDRSYLSVAYNDRRAVEIIDHVSGRTYRFNR